MKEHIVSGACAYLLSHRGASILSDLLSLNDHVSLSAVLFGGNSLVFEHQINSVLD